MSSPKLSIIVPVYNHENYIKQCISGILIQKVDFEYEVLIGEDCSTDNSAGVLKEMQKELPENFYFFYREKNMGMGQNGNAYDLRKRVRGEYVITVEGDDFWTYEYKLQKQVEFLENNKDYVAVAHRCELVNENLEKIRYNIPECKESEYTLRHYLKWTLPGQTATLMYRREYYDRLDEFFAKYKKYTWYPGDRLRGFLLVEMGRIYCFQEKWSVYRFVTRGGSSFTATFKWTRERLMDQELFFESIGDYAKSKGNEAAYEVTRKLYHKCRFFLCFGKNKIHTLNEVFSELFKEKHKYEYLCFILLCICKEIKELFVRLVKKIQKILKSVVKGK